MHADAGPERRQARCEQPALSRRSHIGCLAPGSLNSSGSEFEELKRERPAYLGSQLPNACGDPEPYVPKRYKPYRDLVHAGRSPPPAFPFFF